MAFERLGLPPISVYKIGDVYFVEDGHHRVSVAREMGAPTIEAYVTEIPSKAPLSPRDDIEDLILKAELARFLEETHLDESRPDVDFRVTLPGRVRELSEHIAVHCYYMGQDQQREVSLEEAAPHWVDEVYVPAVRVIRQLGLLQDFPNRTEADIYLWLMKHRSELARELGWELSPEEAAAHLWNRLYTKPRRTWERWRRGLAKVIPIKALDIGPVPTEWRLTREDLREDQSLFPRVLVPISGEDASWNAVDVAILVGQKEHSELRGVHVVSGMESENSPNIAALRAKFESRVLQAGLRGNLVLERGNIHRRVEARSHWSDLVVLHLKHPPGDGPVERLMSGLRTFLQRSPRPVLVVSQKSEMKKALLAFDASRKATEALYLAAYLARRWGVKIVVASSLEHGLREGLALTKAKTYLISHQVEAEYDQRRGRAGQALLAAAADHGCDFILMGGYGQNALMELISGSSTDVVLRGFKGPVWVCN